MKTINKTETIEKVTTTFVAFDGREFQNESECKKHEENIAFQQKRDRVMKFEVLENYAPCNGYYNSEDHYYTWFKVNNQEEYDLLVDTYGDGGYSNTNTFPALFCIEETAEYGNMGYEAYWISLDSCTQYIKELYENLGFTIDIKCL